MAGDAPTIADRDNARALAEGVSRGVALVALKFRLHAANITLPVAGRCDGIGARLVRAQLLPLLPTYPEE